MGGKSEAPPPPDYTGAAIAQGESGQALNEQQTWANRPTINTPFGQQTWDVTPQWDPVTGQYINSWESNIYLTPEQQSALDAQQNIQSTKSGLAEGLLGRLGDEYSQPMDWDSLTQLAGTPQTAQYGPTPQGQNYTPENIQMGVQTNNYSPEDIQRGLDTSNLQDINPAQKYDQQAEDAIYGKFQSRMDPQFTQDKDALRTQLYNSGLKEGDQAYDRAMKTQQQQQDDARQQAEYQAIIGSGAEAERMHGMDLGTRQQQFGERQGAGSFANSAAQQALEQQLGIGGAKFGEATGAGNFANTAAQQALAQQLSIGGQKFNQDVTSAGIADNRANNQYTQNMSNANYTNQLRQQQIAEDMQRRGFSLNEINSILSGQNVGMPGMPSFNTSGKAAAPDLLGAAGMQGQAALDAYGIQQGQQQATGQGLASLGMAAMMFSERETKDNIVPIKKIGDLMLYEFTYKGEDEPQIGFMLEDVESSRPDLVMDLGYGKMLDVRRAYGS